MATQTDNRERILTLWEAVERFNAECDRIGVRLVAGWELPLLSGHCDEYVIIAQRMEDLTYMTWVGVVDDDPCPETGAHVRLTSGAYDFESLREALDDAESRR